MQSRARRILVVLGVLAAVPIAAIAVGYLVTPAAEPVPRTVADDPSLPSATVGGVKLHVRTFGDPARPTVIVLHGGPGNDSRYLLPLAALADAYHVVFYDQRGSGLSERVKDEDLRLEDFYGELDGIVDRFGGGRPVALVGHSWGAMLASGYTGRHPDRVSALVLAEPGMLTSETAALLMAATNGMRPPVSVQVLLAAASAWLGSLHVAGPDADARRDRLVDSLMRTKVEGHPTAGYFCDRDLSTARMEGWRFGARAAFALLAEARGEDGALHVDFVRGVERYERKVLFLAGSCDAILGEEMQRRHMRHFRATQLVVIEGAGHTMFGEKPEESVAAVRGHLDETLARATGSVTRAPGEGGAP